ncbi:hypothetical protein H0H93_011100 [Arthromyces matolae]|nr:hypothetical protein H0H93_011100 [Arthromyces matolae]
MVSNCAKQQKFFASSQFAVIGASSDPSRLASKKEKRLDGLNAIPSISNLPSPSTTALAITAMPHITLSLLKQARELSIPSIWIQPGASDQHVVDFIETNNLSEKVIWGGPCILQEGDRVIQRQCLLGMMPGIYRAVIDDVMANIKSEFDEYGVSEDVLAELQHKWENKVIASHVAEFESPTPAPAAQPQQPHPLTYQHPSLLMHPHYPNPYALPQAGTNPVKTEPMDGRYMLHSGMPYSLPPLPGPVLNNARAAAPPQTSQHPGGQTGVISFPRPLQPQPATSRTAYATATTQPPATAPASQPAQRIPQVDGPSESSGDEDDSPPPPQGQMFAPRTAHPSLPQPRATTSAPAPPVVDSEAINSDLDDSDTEGEEEAEEGIAGETDIVFCTYDKVARVKNKWKCVLKDGMIHVNGKDYLFAKCTGEFEW